MVGAELHRKSCEVIQQSPSSNLELQMLQTPDFWPCQDVKPAGQIVEEMVHQAAEQLKVATCEALQTSSESRVSKSKDKTNSSNSRTLTTQEKAGHSSGI